ncbi:prepilin-type N-terminal cleavage/methylation domain-containing protein [Clostridium oryzae]|uniref:Putative major pilin subunit n=1 Tax=Clostridium oryzae TaxID=1450648 RepID=A0A1V4INS7_9CLOT|nr:prepilin-type N-terminal cleavage/methylation domain-containing protein [Clostridium oryzae]OPJ61519.1 putative major pilin subunit [Clostridium oryzae]
MSNNLKKKKKKGFTLIELIIVLAVLAIIAAIAIPNFIAVRNNSRNKADAQSCLTIKRTVLMLVSDGTVPETADFYVTGPSTTSLNTEKYKDDVNEAMKDVNNVQGTKLVSGFDAKGQPQYSDGTPAMYHVVISKGDVSVTTVVAAAH